MFKRDKGCMGKQKGVKKEKGKGDWYERKVT